MRKVRHCRIEGGIHRAEPRQHDITPEDCGEKSKKCPGSAGDEFPQGKMTTKDPLVLCNERREHRGKQENLCGMTLKIVLRCAHGEGIGLDRPAAGVHLGKGTQPRMNRGASGGSYGEYFGLLFSESER